MTVPRGILELEEGLDSAYSCSLRDRATSTVLRELSPLFCIASPEAKVMRQGRIINVATEEVVPGDDFGLTPGTGIAASKLESPLLIVGDVERQSFARNR